MSLVPAPAATIVVLRDGDDGVEVLMVKRPGSAAFLAHAWVFPGGRVERQDAESEWAWMPGATPSAPTRAPLTATASCDDHRHRLAAIRELFEEVGILLARTPAGELVGEPHVPREELAASRRDLSAGARSFGDACRERGWRPATDVLVPVSRWVTPVGEARRFDTRFFATRVPDGQTPTPDDEEAVAAEWMRPSEAIAAADRGTVVLAPPTRHTLAELASSSSSDAALRAIAARPCPTVAPRVHVEWGTRYLLLPGDPLYPTSGDVTVPAPTRVRISGARPRVGHT